jgi:hypothetical protein
MAEWVEPEINVSPGGITWIGILLKHRMML